MRKARAASGPVCYVHIGTHKTGTTAIQRFCAANVPALQAAGTYYPRVGRWSEEFPGHHNIAWELNEDPRFDPARGTLAELSAEIAASGASRICLSSEDFEYLHVRPDRIARLRDTLLAAGYTPVVVVFLREQADYAESLFAQLVKHGSTVPFDRFVAAVERDGVVRYHDRWVFRFEYSRLIEPFRAVLGSDAVVVRPYRNDGSPTGVIGDFLEIVAPERAPAAFPVPPAIAHARSPVGAVIGELFSNTAAALGRTEVTSLADGFVAGDSAAEPFAALSAHRRSEVTARFAGDNAALGLRLQPMERASAERARRLFAQAEAARTALLAERSESGSAAG